MRVLVDGKEAGRLLATRYPGELLTVPAGESGPFGDLTAGDTIFAPGQWITEAKVRIPSTGATVACVSANGDSVGLYVRPKDYNNCFVSAGRMRIVAVTDANVSR
jgi:hypothetical protein